MVKLIRMWYKSRVVKYTALSTTRSQLQEKYNNDPGSLTLTELGQLHYMGQEFLTIEQIIKEENKGKTKTDPDDVVEAIKNDIKEAVSKDGMYL